MQSWEQFKSLEPKLIQIEEAFAQYEAFEAYYTSDNFHSHGLTPLDLEEVRRETLDALRTEIRRLPARVYYWLLPFYSGNFLTLLRAIERLADYDPEARGEVAKRSFLHFFTTLPFAERVVMGINLNSTELIYRTHDVLGKIEEKKQSVAQRIDQLHSN